MLHKANPDTTTLDRLAAVVVRAALVWERERAKAQAVASERSYSNRVAETDPALAAASDDLQKAVEVYRQALVDETVPGEERVAPPPRNADC